MSGRKTSQPEMNYSRPSDCVYPDCFNCPYPDCEWDGVDKAERESAAFRDNVINYDKRKVKHYNDDYHYHQEGREPTKRKAKYDPVKNAIQVKRFRENHKEYIAAYQREYYRKHREEIIERTHAYYQEHKEEISKQKRDKYHADIEAGRERVRRSAAKRKARLRQEKLQAKTSDG